MLSKSMYQITDMAIPYNVQLQCTDCTQWNVAHVATASTAQQAEELSFMGKSRTLNLLP